MSEYQYYEFQAIDRPLAAEETDELRSYSTRARITAPPHCTPRSPGIDLCDSPAPRVRCPFESTSHRTWPHR
jgi:hypothetical protein